jgi:hypothetical protein
MQIDADKLDYGNLIAIVPVDGPALGAPKRQAQSALADLTIRTGKAGHA